MLTEYTKFYHCMYGKKLLSTYEMIKCESRHTVPKKIYSKQELNMVIIILNDEVKLGKKYDIPPPKT